MAATIKLKNSVTSSSSPSSLSQGEVALNITDKKLWVGNASSTPVQLLGDGAAASLTTLNGLTVGKGAGAVSTNTAVGASALTSNSTGPDATVVGYQAGYSSTGGYLTAVGYKAGYAVSSGTDNVFMGWNTGLSTTTGSSNVAMGDNAFRTNTTGGNNLALGHAALYSNTTASNNTAVGYQAGYTNTTGVQSVFVGYQAGYLVTGSYNHAFGYGAMSGGSTTGTQNTAVARFSLNSLTSGSNNVGVGDSTLQNTTTGGNNTALGMQALLSNTTAINNTAVGYQAGYSNTTGIESTFIGYKAGYGHNGSTGVNTCVGAYAGLSLTSGNNNTFVGSSVSGYYVTTGSKNTILGAYNGNQGGLDIRTASNYIVLSDGDGNPRGYFGGGVWAFNNGAAASQVVAGFYNDNASTPYGIYVAFTAAAPNNTTNYVFKAQDSSTSMYTIWSNGTTSGRSDARLKKNIVDATPKLDDICRLQVRNYEWNESIDGHKEIGLIAQEVETVFPGLVITHDLEKDGDDYKEVKYSAFVPMLIKAIQELKAEIDTLKGQA